MPTMMVAMRVVMTLTTTCAPSALLAQDENRTKMHEDDNTDKTGNNSNYPVHPGDAPDKIAYDKWIRDTVETDCVSARPPSTCRQPTLLRSAHSWQERL